ncbi:MAG: UDP-N-acetylmuramoyl-L-alanine--D-glutamate ligase, partial [Microbacteriaceae bacterium]|nr:UDP-N-acetylmuramoyl-L-alanine--D-glutamate ligase [Microbacteriaceae bacterium]
AITLARKYATAGDIVLLSPGAPSFGQYQDYQARADDFRHAIESTTPKENP